MLNDKRGIFFTTPHWNGYPAVLMRMKASGRPKQELEDVVAEAWLTKAQKRVSEAWLADRLGSVAGSLPDRVRDHP